MRKIFSLILLAVFFAANFSYAATIGSPNTMGRNRFSVGLDSEYVFNKEFKNTGMTQDDGAGTIIAAGSSAKINCMYREMVKISYGILDNLDIYFKLGMGQMVGMRNFTEGQGLLGGLTQFALYSSVDSKSEVGLACGAGLKGKVNLPGKLSNWMLGCDTQYLRQTNRTKNSFWQNVLVNIPPWVEAPQSLGSDRGFTTYEEWHAAPYIAYKIKNFTPYVGGKYSYARMKFETDSSGGGNLRTGSQAGAFAGLDVAIGEHVSLNVEGNYFDQTSISSTVAYKF